jgi:hypothetical protein
MCWKSHWKKKRGSILPAMNTVTILQNGRRGIPMLPTKPPFHLVKTGMWCAVTRCRIAEPIFLEIPITQSFRITQFLASSSTFLRENCWSFVPIKQLNLSYSTGDYARFLHNFFYRTLLNTVSTTIIHVIWKNWQPLYPKPLPTFRPWRCKQSLRICFAVFGYVCNMLMHIFKTSYNRS